ncbi:hypothetical protein KZZ52_49105 [Dactylosporangium sp. AC04546]|uniref:hypothetical protein n=1 Tax=Dactylosporangium sp. AC04546 TaxID=2862460 RepID=UPI001EDC9B16|nr:hypothetical protein [Dactylosporangium sp. AC04546]WVK81847.1 hypothetical protein KZZ52_49105 [Dactylosporangium sp. AC04546]
MTWDEERAAATVATLMHHEDVSPMRVDVHAAVLAGRRGARRRMIVNAGVVIVVLAGVSVVGVRLTGRDPVPEPPAAPWKATAVQPLTCTTAPFGDHPDQETVISVDPTGSNVLTSVSDPVSPGTRLVRYADGVRTVLDVPKGRLADAVVNRAGLVVGFSNTTSAPVMSSVWAYRGETPQELPLPTGYQTVQDVAINGLGDVVATVTSGDTTAVALWTAATPDRPRVYPADRSGFVYAIADDGSVVGVFGLTSTPSGPENRGWLWSPDGTGRDLAVPPGWTGGTATAFHASWVMGSVTQREPAPGAPGLRSAPARWNLATGAVEVMSGIEFEHRIQAIPTGWFIITAPPKSTAVVAPDGRLFNLPGPADAENQYAAPSWISDDGRRMVGNVVSIRTTGTDPGPYTKARATTWSCTPGR